MILPNEFIERARAHPFGERRRCGIALKQFVRFCRSLFKPRKEALKIGRFLARRHGRSIARLQSQTVQSRERSGRIRPSLIEICLRTGKRRS